MVFDKTEQFFNFYRLDLNGYKKKREVIESVENCWFGD